MHLESLQVFCDVVETRSFSRAARLHRITQSAVSQQIRALEKRFERKLLDRTPRAIAPTPAGERLYQSAREVLASFELLESRMRESGGEVMGPVTIATIDSVGLHELQPHLKTVLRRYPRLNVRVRYRRSDQVYDDVASGDAEVGLVAYPRDRRDLEVIPFSEDRLEVIVPAEHPLARRNKVSLAELDGVPFVAFTRDIPTRRGIDRLLRAYGATPKLAMELDNIETLKRGVEIGAGITILPHATVAAEVQAGLVCALTITDGDFRRPTGILLHKTRSLSRAAQALVGILAPGGRGSAAK